MQNMVEDVTLSNDRKTLTVSYMSASAEDQTYTLDTGLDIDETRYNVDDDHTLHFYDSDGNELQNLAVEITGGGGGGGGSTAGSIIVGRITAANTQTLFGNDYNIEYTVTAMDASGEECGAGVGTLYVNSVAVATGFAVDTSTIGAYNTISVGDYLSVGTNTIRISVSVNTGGENNSVSSKTWSVNAVNMYMSWNYSDSDIHSSAFQDSYTPFGALNKTIYTFIDVDPIGFNPSIVDELPDLQDPEISLDDIIGVNYFVGAEYSHYVYDSDTQDFV